ncbi:MAG: glycosyltransferase [Chitinophagaceae bacterium]|nr:MAG: glycosyltransferase [Chitinophagaceae bacterium]
MFYSFIIPLYNRPDEIKELLDSLLLQTMQNFEVVIIEDGSDIKSDKIAEQYSDKLDIQYFFKENEGQGFTRNYGMKRAKGDYFIILDSDCILPTHYLETADKEIKSRKLDIYGGPDAAHPSFTPIQKAISYSMTSLFTTGGIRGKKKHVGVFHPRSFNMGVSREVFEKTGGFKITRMGEDLEWSIRIQESGFKSGLIEEAYVYHKRRTDFKRFFNQLYFFGRARINVSYFYPKTLKIIHFFPLIFLSGAVFSILLLFIFPVPALFLVAAYGVYTLLIWMDSLRQTQSFQISLLSIITSWIQLTAYGLGFLHEFWKRKILRKENNIDYYPQ